MVHGQQVFDPAALERGALNLLQGCAGARAGESLAIFREDPAAGYFGAGLAESVAEAARRLGLRTRLFEVPFDPEADRLSADQEAAVQAHDHALFLARLGDQLRFKPMPAGAKPIVSYVLDRESLAGPFGTAAYAAFAELKPAFDRAFAGARRIRVTCPLGTDFEGTAPVSPGQPNAEVTIKRFPLSVFAPLPAAGFSGRVAVAHFLLGTGSRYYAPFALPIETVLFAEIGGGRLRGWQGEPALIRRAEAHYADIAGRFGIDGGYVHSWHAGIHPGCGFSGPAGHSPERWSGSAFGNPRLLHFHTCGAYAPGEICWNIVDPTIEVDGIALWRAGRIDPTALPGVGEILARHPEVAALFARPERRIGLGSPE